LAYPQFIIFVKEHSTVYLAGDLVVQIQKHLERMAASSQVLEAVEFSTIIEAAWMDNELGEYAPTFPEWLRSFRAGLQHG
jgi:hypothetical protein